MTKLYHNNKLVLTMEKLGFKGQKFTKAFENYLNKIKSKSRKGTIHTLKAISAHSEFIAVIYFDAEKNTWQECVLK